jgi:hypothetical protein
MSLRLKRNETLREGLQRVAEQRLDVQLTKGTAPHADLQIGFLIT